ncbi:hypothetical protein DPMN_061432 [Dreissena polymorpha]|uniref:Uncharacterized protein n=1 Tax=Dreissena polymorpha TaxID=45954 RepID=A0A9D4HJ60_DREPO|nr:hypothetical protein DPMN_061432 [Dreissena polymorpha]
MNKILIACLVLVAVCVALTTAQGGFAGRSAYDAQSPLAALGYRPQPQQQQQPFDMNMLFWLAMMENW